MRSTGRRLWSAAATAALAFGGLVATAPSSQAAPCGFSKVQHTSWTYVASNKIYRQTPYTSYYKNCTSSTQKKRLDIAWGIDIGCKSVTPGKTVSWYWVKNSANPAYIRGVANC